MARELYEKILETANQFLTAANRFTINVLQGFDPSFEQLAKIMHDAGKLVYELVDDVDPHLAAKALDYCECMTRMAIAIRRGDTISLEQVVTELEKKPFC